MERKELESLEKVLHNLEGMIIKLIYAEDDLKNDDIKGLQNSVMSCINILDTIVPQPLPPKPENEDNNENKSKKDC